MEDPLHSQNSVHDIELFAQLLGMGRARCPRDLPDHAEGADG